MKTIISNTVVALGLIAVVAAIVFAKPAQSASAAQAIVTSTSGAADQQVAEKYGRLDHSSLNSPSIQASANPAPAAVAAYETPPL